MEKSRTFKKEEAHTEKDDGRGQRPLLILNAFADRAALLNSGCSALHHSAIKGHADAVDILLKAGLDKEGLDAPRVSRIGLVVSAA